MLDIPSTRPSCCISHLLPQANPQLTPLTTKLSSPVRAPLNILRADRRSGPLNRLDKVLEHEWWLKHLLALDFRPGHFCRAGIAWGAGRVFLVAIDCDLRFVVLTSGEVNVENEIGEG